MVTLFYRDMKRFVLASLIILVPGVLVASDASVDYSREILPILAENCFKCHGPDAAAREADLRLDNADGAYADLVGAVAIAPGDPENSELIYRINHADGDERMPPKDSKKSLTQEQKSLLRTWIEQGAKYDDHWAFLKPQKRKLPKHSKHPVDAFVLDRLKKEGLKPAEPTDPYTLARRVYLDLIGLPPNPKEIAAFVKDHKRNESKAIETLVDDLMQRPVFGEKWARHWLDVARYADSNGYEKDKPRDQWIYRDWVIEALNNDMPYDQFLIEQLAGDLLPNRTQDQLIATGFMRNGMINEEGAIIVEQFRVDGIFDRMDTFGKAALGLTIRCAQCHTHKFDPITHDEYYSLFAFFNETHEAKSWVYSDEQLKEIDSIKSQVRDLKDQIREERPNWKQELASWKEKQRAKESIWKTWDTNFQDWQGGLNHPVELDDHSILTLGHPTVSGYSVTEGESNLPLVTGLQLEALTHPDQPFKGPGRSYWGTFAISEMKIFRKWPGEEDWTPVELSKATADFETEEGTMNDYFFHAELDKPEKRKIGPANFLIDGNEKTAWAPDRGPILRHTDSVAVVEFKEPLAMPDGSQLRVELVQSHGGGKNGRDNQQLGRYRFALTATPHPSAPEHEYSATRALSRTEEDLSEDQQRALFRAWSRSVREFDELYSKIDRLEAGYSEAKTSVLHTIDSTPEFARQSHLLDRGGWNKPTYPVNRKTPAILNAFKKENPTRLDLAHWVTSKEAPLTARVQVNRIWQACFGTGLVTTPEDFGTRAKKPEHLELLDWLAVDFMDNGWSQKASIKKILTSKTYQQSSNLSEELQDRDPNNTLLARGPRFRTEAEVLRDLALAASGLLTQKIGGPSIFPPVPDSVIKYNYVVPDYWYPAEDENRYRRSLYMFRKRSMPDPVLTSFDAPNADESCAGRGRTNTPLSALTSLNETIFVEASQGLAQRILKEGGQTNEERANYGYLLTTGRPATKFETKEIVSLIDSQNERLADGWLDIRQIAFKDSENIPELPDGISPRDVASWTIASRVLLNLDETLTKN
jgi:mono/diheme cytochrome c family protein